VSRPMNRKRGWVAALITVAAIAACTQNDLAESRAMATADMSIAGNGAALPVPAPPPAAKAEPVRLSREELASTAKMPVQSAAANAATSFAFQDPAAMIIRTGTALVEVDSLEAAIASVRSFALQLGGQLANVSVQTGEERNRRAILEVKVPSARFDDALNRIEPLGDVKSVEVQAQDVGEEYVDIAARVANARRLEERLIQLLAARTGKLSDVLDVERELARVREEIDRMEGRLRYLRSRVAVSTLTLTVHEPLPLLTQPGQNVILQAFVQAGHNFIDLLSAFIASLGYLLPLGTIALIAFLVWRKYKPVATVPVAPAA
jgi:hypothetical protein